MQRLLRGLRITLFAIIFFVGLSMPASAFFCANTMAPCDPRNPKSNCYVPPTPCPKCQPKACKKCTTSPVYAASGVYETSGTDLSIPTNGFPLEASRQYSSAHAIDGPTGFGWSSSFHARLHYAVYLFAAPSTYQRMATVIMPDGNHYEFTDNGAGVFTPPLGRYDNLVRNTDGTFDLTLQRSRSKLHFGTDGALLSLTDDYGNALTYTYDATSGRLQRVSDASGSSRYLDVTWGPNGRISAVQDNTGRIVQVAARTGGVADTLQTTTRRVVRVGQRVAVVVGKRQQGAIGAEVQLRSRALQGEVKGTVRLLNQTVIPSRWRDEVACTAVVRELVVIAIGHDHGDLTIVCCWRREQVRLGVQPCVKARAPPEARRAIDRMRAVVLTRGDEGKTVRRDAQVRAARLVHAAGRVHW